MNLGNINNAIKNNSISGALINYLKIYDVFLKDSVEREREREFCKSIKKEKKDEKEARRK